MVNWRKVALEDVAEVKLSNIDKMSNSNEIEVRLCNYTDVYKNAFINSEKARNFMTATCNKNEFDNLKLCKGQVAITKDSEKRDDIGISTFIAEDFDNVVLGYHTSLITPNEKDLSGSYLYYWLNTKQAKIYFENNAGGSGQRCTLPLNIIKAIPLYLPDITTQKKISLILSTLDCKIELNNRVNTELEAISRMLYDYWFVQFDFPDKNGKPYKSSGGRMVWKDEIKREIPEGWELKPLSKITDISNESINPFDLPEKEYKHYSIPAFDKFGTYLIEKGNEIKSNKFLIRNTDVLVSKLNPRFNRVIFSVDEIDLISSTEFVVWRTKNVAIKNYIYMIAKDASFIAYCSQCATGTSNSHKRVNPTVMMRYQIVYNEEIAKRFGNTLGSSIKMYAKNQVENKILSELRDWLLPMLMNGQIKVE